MDVATIARFQRQLFSRCRSPRNSEYKFGIHALKADPPISEGLITRLGYLQA